MSRVSFEESLGEGVSAEPMPCDACGSITPAWALYQGEGEEPAGWICGLCIMDTARAIEEAATQAAKLPDSDWASDVGVFLKAQRVTLLEQSRWAIMPDSPLSIECQARWKSYLVALNRMTLDCASPLDWTWPDVPTLEYPAPLVGEIAATVRIEAVAPPEFFEG